MSGTGPTYGRLASHMILRDNKTKQRYITNEYVRPDNYRSLTWHPVKPGTWKNKGYTEIAGDISKLRTSTKSLEGKRTKELPNYIEDRKTYRKRSARRKAAAKRATATKPTTSRKRKATAQGVTRTRKPTTGKGNTTSTKVDPQEARLARIRKRQRKIEARQNKKTSKKKTPKVTMASFKRQMNAARRRAIKTRKPKRGTRTTRGTTANSGATRSTAIDLS